MIHGYHKAASISHRLSPIVIPKRGLIQIPGQVKRFNAHVGSANAAFQETPEVFESVGMNTTAYIAAGVVNHFMRVVRGQSLIRKKCVRTKKTLRRDVLSDLCLQSISAAIRYSKRPNFSTPFKNPESRSLVLEAPRRDNTVALGLVHKPSGSPDECFVC